MRLHDTRDLLKVLEKLNIASASEKIMSELTEHMKLWFGHFDQAHPGAYAPIVDKNEEN